MRFGLLYEAQRPFQGTSVDWNTLYKETLEQCVLAEKVGFDNLWFVEHSDNVMMTNAAVSPGGRLLGNFPRWTDVPTPSVGEASAREATDDEPRT